MRRPRTSGRSRAATGSIVVASLVLVLAAGEIRGGAETPEGFVPAFPGARGHGAGAVGGRGGRVIAVTNLRDSGPGSFRAAVGARGRRTVVFRVGGTIELESRIDIQHPYLTIAGQTAPGGGILLRGTERGGGQMLRVRTHDVIIRYIRIRSGRHGRPGRGQINLAFDPLPARGERYGDIHDVIVDHVSLSWSLDENLAVFRNVPEEIAMAGHDYPTIHGISIQRCLIAEGLYPHSTGIQAGGERIFRDGRELYNGGRGVYDLSIHENLFANTSHRNPGLGCRSARVIGNVMYNWSSKCSESHSETAVDWIGNCFKPGPLSSPERLIVHNAFLKGHPEHAFPPPSIHLSGNRNLGRPEQSDHEMYSVHYADSSLPASWLRSDPLPRARFAVEPGPAEEVYERVLSDVGANARLDASGEWIPNADAVDRRILDDVRRGRGSGALVDGQRLHFTHPDEVDGYPELSSGEPYPDADGDGMSDAWERLVGLDPEDGEDHAGDRDGDGMTNLEEFLNGTDPGEPRPSEVVDIGSRRELFVDDLLIGELDGTRLELHHPRRLPRDAYPPRPTGHYATVLKDGDIYRLYYRGDKVPGAHWRDGWTGYHRQEVTLYAESKDGYHWTKPDLGMYELEPFPEGNVVLDEGLVVNHNFSPFVDTRPGVPADQKYKALGGLNYPAPGWGGWKTPDERDMVTKEYGPPGLRAYVSPDGIHWRRLTEKPVLTDGAFDSQNVAFWSPAEQQYICYYRVMKDGLRSIARATSKDFLHWSAPSVMGANQPGEHLYTNGTHPYVRAPHIYIALPTRFMARRSGITDIVFMATRPGSGSYTRLFREAFIRPGVGEDGWGNRSNYIAWHVVPTSDTELSMYNVSGDHYVLRLDGFISVHAGADEGEFITEVLRFSGRELEINESTSAAGRIRVEIQDPGGKPVDGFALDDCESIYGDRIRCVVSWGSGERKSSDVSRLAGRPVRLRFVMQEADLYSLRFH